MTADALGDAGLNVRASLSVATYDEIVPTPWRAENVHPGSRSVEIVGNGGRAFWDAFTASPEYGGRTDPLDRYLRRVLEEHGGACATYWEQRQDHYLPLTALASRAGLGTMGRVGVLLHPQFGPWLSLRAVLYRDEEVSDPDPPWFDPCNGCPAPCATACHGSAVGVSGRDGARCLRTKLSDIRCLKGCDARSACVVAPEHAFTREAIAHHEQLRR